MIERDGKINLAAWVLGAGVLVALDQYTKMLAVLRLKGQPPFVLIENVFEFLYSENRGAAFGMLQGQQLLFYVIAAIVLVASAWVMAHLPDFEIRRYHALKLCIIMITAGAVGNLIDRGLHGYVVDFIYFKLINFPIFNVADIYVTTATTVLMLLLMFYYDEEDLWWFRSKSPAKIYPGDEDGDGRCAGEHCGMSEDDGREGDDR